jgi:hypothetical protein
MMTLDQVFNHCPMPSRKGFPVPSRVAFRRRLVAPHG